MSIDWGKFQQDVERLYLHESRSAMETIRCINQKHGSDISIRQFKSRYGGLKKLQAKEWMAIISQIRESANREEYSVYLYNHKQNQKRVDRAFRLYGKKIDVSNLIGIDLGMNTVNKHRIEIRAITKKKSEYTRDEKPDDHIKADDLWPSSMSFSAFDQHTNPEHAACNYSDLSGSSLRDVSLLNIEVNEVGFERQAPNANGWDGGFSFLNFQQWDFEQLDQPFVVPQYFNHESPNNSKIDYPLFWREMKDTDSCGIFQSDWTEDIMNDTRSSVIYRATQRLVREMDGWLYSRLIQADNNLAILEKAAFQLEGILSNHQSHSTSLCENKDQTTLYQIFLIIVYFVSNNDLEEALFSRFIFWVIDNQLIRHLNLLLCMALSYGIVFRNAFLHLIPRLKFYDKSEWARPSFLKSYPCESLEMIQQADTRLLLGLRGTKILVEAVRANHLEAVIYLVKKGADINGNDTHGIPLAVAAEKGFTSILSYLIECGADPNCNMPNSALLAAIKHKSLTVVRILLKAGAKIDLSWKFDGMLVGQWIRRELPEIYAEFREHKSADEILRVYFLIEAAEKGESVLKQYLMDQRLENDEMLEKALYHAIKWGSDGAVRTLLYKSTDPKVQKHKSQGMMSGGSMNDDIDLLMLTLDCQKGIMQNILYHLRKAGQTIEKAALQNYKQKYEKEGIQVLDDFIIALAKVGFDLQIVGPSALEVVLTRRRGFRGFQYEDSLFQCGVWLDLGCPINEYGLRGLSGLQAAAKSGNLTLVLEFIKRGANVNLEASDNGLTALQAAAKSGKSIVVDCLLDAGADCRLPPAKHNGFTALEAAAHPESGDVEITEMSVLGILKRLINIGAPINRCDGNANRLLLGLIASNFTKCLELVVRSGAYVGDTALSLGGAFVSPLQAAAMRLNHEAVRLLLCTQANVNAPAHPDNGRTALQAAMSKGEAPPEQQAIVELLLQHGANVNALPAENSGRTVLQEAAFAENANPATIKFLIDCGANVNAFPAKSNGFTALQGAAMRGNLEIIRLLLDRGADINAPAALDNGRNVVEGAAENGRLDALKLLFNYGTFSLHLETGFERAIQFATNKGHWHIVDFLREHIRLINSHNPLASLDMTRM